MRPSNPAREVPQDWKDAWEQANSDGFDINRLFDGGDPFSAEA